MKKIVALFLAVMTVLCIGTFTAFAKSDSIGATDSNGRVVISSVTTAGFLNFGEINAPENVLDMDQSTVTGSSYNAGVQQSVTLHFAEPALICEVFVQCKDEGGTTNEDNSRGTYTIYAYNGGVETKLGVMKARTGTDGGETLKLDTPVEADSVMIVITSWEGTNWACVADAYVVAESNGKPPVAEEKRVTVDHAESSGFLNFGTVNDPANILDMDQNTCTGSTFNAEVEQSVTLVFKEKTAIEKVFVQCKDEGTTTNADGTRGTYRLYAILDGKQTEIGELKAVTGTDGGDTLSLANPVEADAIKIVITSWQGNLWANVADAYAVPASGEMPPQGGENTGFLILLAVVAFSGAALTVLKYLKYEKKY